MDALTKRLKAVKLVERASRHELETIAAELSALNAEQNRLQQLSEDLSNQAQQEVTLSTTETHQQLISYLRSVDVQRVRWAERHTVLEQEAKKVEDRLYDAFRDIKTKELFRSGLEREIKLTEERAEAALQDDGVRALYRMNIMN